MRIKRLELMGFKSFMSKTVINFDEKVTGIVGPNGCGKSNIIDALLWVMGEQSPKSLRGGSMEDVIFAGSDKRKPSSLAEVSITLENDGVFPVNYLNFTEIKVTRRLYRDGESEYLINKVPVRLRDVREVFMDSGARAYAVIEQGEIEKIILSKPDDRRTLIEEAAGITKYKVRKEESKRKLDTTEQNLLRLNDIISEISRQLNQLEKQAKKAVEFRKLREELKDLELRHASCEFVKIDKEVKHLKERLSVLEQNRDSAETELAGQELNIESDKAKKLGIEEKLANLQEQTIGLNTDIHKAKAKLEMIEAEKNNLASGAEIRRHEIESLSIRLERERQELAAINEEFNSHGENVKKAEEEVNTAQSGLDSKLSEQGALTAEIDDKKARLLELVQKELTAKNNISNFGERLESNIVKLERYREDKNRCLNEFQSVKETLGLLEENLADTQKKRSESEEQLKCLHENYSDTKRRLEIREKDREELKNSLADIRSRLKALVDLSNRMEGMSGGVRNVMSSGGWNDRVKGLVADIVETDAEYEKALSAVLGTNLEAMVLDNAEDSFDIINFLKNDKKGLASFIPRHVRSVRKSHGDFIFNGSGSGLVHLPDVVRFNPEYENIFRVLLGNVFVVPDLAAGLRLWNQAQANDFILVTRDGDVLDGMGVLRGGSTDSADSGLLERKREIKELESLNAQTEEKLAVAEEQYKSLLETIEGINSSMENTKNDINRLSVEIASLSKETDAAREDTKRQEQRLSEITFDIDQLCFENDHLEREIKSSTDISGQSGELIKQVESEIEAKKNYLNSLNRELEILRGNLTDLKVSASAVSERFRGIEERKNFLASALESDTARLDNLGGEQERAKVRASELTQETESVTRQSYLDMEKLDTVTREITDVKYEYSQVVDLLSAAEDRIKEERNNVSRIKDEMNNLSISLAEVSVSTGVMTQKIYDKYEVNLADVYSGYVTAEYDPESGGIKIDELNDRISRIGEVNLFAIEEFERLSQRHEFLTAQRDDLVRSMEDLKSAIKKIDDTSKERFRRTFELVNDKFQKFFPILFGGGKAQLVMIDPSDLLSTGVDIIAQLPGKKTQNLNLFSGGEKALTAISLVFSIFAIKPSPFCVLDEVDAPLDDANITRFNEAIKALMEKTQFTIITHNKRTMEMLEVLYGVTMEEPGVSRMVSVRIGEVSARAENQDEDDVFYREDVFLQ
ncbi:MAG: chromosome segregation protein SMC [Oligoflexia bacterium]|nr:chromosome segregation protein SMC [Oligoflexia bacterium]